jgi:hypothetical protein
MMDIENRYANHIYIHRDDDIYVMLGYIPSHSTRISVPILSNALRS